MTEIKRYEVVLADGVPAHRPSESGRWVKHEDLSALQEQVRALAAENVVIKSSVPNLKDIEFDNENMDDVSLGEDIGFNEAVELMKKRLGQTPAHDAALRELRAQGVDAFAVDCKVKASKENLVFWMDASSAAEEFAARTRAGEQP